MPVMYLLDMKRLLSTIIILRIHKKYLHSVVGLSVGRARDEEEDVCPWTVRHILRWYGSRAGRVMKENSNR